MNICAKSFTNHPLLWSIHQQYRTVNQLATKYDMVIVGGGMVGVGLLALAGSSNLLRTKQILLVDNTPRRKYLLKEEYESRVVALNQLSQKMLEKIGAWDIIASNRFQPIRTMKIWETESDSRLMFKRNSLASIVENNLIIDSLLQCISKKNSTDNQFTIINQASVENIQLSQNGHHECPDQLVTLNINQDKNIQTIKTNLLIGADGSQSSVRKAANLQCVSWNHDQKAIVATLKIGENHEEYTAWQRFLPTGPLALLPLPNGYSSLVWSTSSTEADRLLSLDDEQFVDELNHQLNQPNRTTPLFGSLLTYIGETAFGLLDKCVFSETVDSSTSSTSSWPVPIVECIQPKTKRLCFPLGFQHATNYTTSRVALVGDAAHRILPLAGQGVNLGFGDIISLVKQLENAVSHGADIGNETYLQNYTTERQRYVIPLAATMEILNAIYTNQSFGKISSNLLPKQLTEYLDQLSISCKPLVNLRSAAMNTVQSSQLMKNFFINAAITGQFGSTVNDTIKC